MKHLRLLHNAHRAKNGTKFLSSISYALGFYCSDKLPLEGSGGVDYLVGVELWVRGGEQSIAGEDGIRSRHKHHGLAMSQYEG